MNIRDVTIPQAALAALGLTVVIAFVVAGTTSAAAFDIYNPNWDGGGSIQSIAEERGSEVRVVTDTAAYASAPDRSLAFVIGAEEPYEPDAIENMQQFLDNGGTIVVADRNPEMANPILVDLGATASVNGAILRDDQEYYRSPALPVGTNVSEHEYTAGVDSLALNYGTSIDPDEATVLVNSSEFAYLDENGNEELDDEEELRQQPIVTIESVGNGTVVTVGDGSALINAMLERDGNRAFVTALVDNHRTVLFDRSHHSSPPPLQAVMLFIRGSPLVQVVLGLGAIGAVGGWRRGWQSRAFWRRDG